MAYTLAEYNNPVYERYKSVLPKNPGETDEQHFSRLTALIGEVSAPQFAPTPEQRKVAEGELYIPPSAIQSQNPYYVPPAVNIIPTDVNKPPVSGGGQVNYAGSTPTPVVSPTQPVSTAPGAISQQDYFLRPGESIEQYNARIAALRSGASQPAQQPIQQPAQQLPQQQPIQPSQIPQEGYYLKQGETIDQYNTRMDELRKTSPARPTIDQEVKDNLKAQGINLDETDAVKLSKDIIIEYTKVDKEYADKVAEININPWLSEGLRSKKVAVEKEKYDLKKDQLTNRVKLQLDFIKLRTDTAKDEKNTVNNLIQTYPDAGILPTDSLTVAAIKAAKSPSFIAKSKTRSGLADIKAENFDRIKLEAAALFEKDRQRNADGKITPALYLEMRQRVPVSFRDDFDRAFKDLLSEESKKQFGIPEKTDLGSVLNEYLNRLPLQNPEEE